MPLMSRDYHSLGSTPYGVECAQVGASNYAEYSKVESKVYIAQLLREFGEPPEGVRIHAKHFPHDFGSYVEVVVSFNPDCERSALWAMNVENNTPEHWDDISHNTLVRRGVIA